MRMSTIGIPMHIGYCVQRRLHVHGWETGMNLTLQSGLHNKPWVAVRSGRALEENELGCLQEA